MPPAATHNCPGARGAPVQLTSLYARQRRRWWPWGTFCQACGAVWEGQTQIREPSEGGKERVEGG